MPWSSAPPVRVLEAHSVCLGKFLALVCGDTADHKRGFVHRSDGYCGQSYSRRAGPAAPGKRLGQQVLVVVGSVPSLHAMVEARVSLTRSEGLSARFVGSPSCMERRGGRSHGTTWEELLYDLCEE